MDKLIFPLNTGKISWSMKTGQEWTVRSYVSASGAQKTLCQQERPKWSMEVKFPCLTKHEVDVIKSFYAKCKGSWKPFYYKDYEHFEVLGRELAMDADGKYQAVVPVADYEEPAELIDNVVVFVDGKRTKDFTVDGGLITVNTSGNIMKFDYEYYYKVAFSGALSISQTAENFYSLSLKMVVAR